MNVPGGRDVHHIHVWRAPHPPPPPLHSVFQFLFFSELWNTIFLLPNQTSQDVKNNPRNVCPVENEKKGGLKTYCCWRRANMARRVRLDSGGHLSLLALSVATAIARLSFALLPEEHSGGEKKQPPLGRVSKLRFSTNGGK